MKRSRRSFKGAGQTGAVAVELALMLPIFLALLLSVLDLALLLRDHQILENSVREAARYSALQKAWVDPRNPGATEDDIKNFVVNYCAEQDLTIAAGNITVDQDSTLTAGSRTFGISRITATYSRAPLVFATATQLRSEAIFRNFY